MVIAYREGWCWMSKKGRRVGRGQRFRRRLIEIHGGKCLHCGFSHARALEFHHWVPADKEFSLNARSLSCRSWEEVIEESVKCALLCSRCHTLQHVLLDRIVASMEEREGF